MDFATGMPDLLPTGGAANNDDDDDDDEDSVEVSDVGILCCPECISQETFLSSFSHFVFLCRIHFSLKIRTETNVESIPRTTHKLSFDLISCNQN